MKLQYYFSDYIPYAKEKHEGVSYILPEILILAFRCSQSKVLSCFKYFLKFSIYTKKNRIFIHLFDMLVNVVDDLVYSCFLTQKIGIAISQIFLLKPSLWACSLNISIQKIANSRDITGKIWRKFFSWARCKHKIWIFL